jgi:hypothetical protein
VISSIGASKSPRNGHFFDVVICFTLVTNRCTIIPVRRLTLDA